MTQKEVAGVGVRLIGVYWISCGLIDLLLGVARAAGANLGTASTPERDLIFAALNALVGFSFLASAHQIADLLYPEGGRLNRD